jgi:hypothetical protein
MTETGEFKEKLIKRIYMMRPRVSIDKSNQMKGRNYNSDMWAYEGIVGAVLSHVNKYKEIPEIPYAQGLTLNVYQINSGYYDKLIIYILSHLATIDYYLENSLDLH